MFVCPIGVELVPRFDETCRARKVFADNQSLQIQTLLSHITEGGSEKLLRADNQSAAGLPDRTSQEYEHREKRAAVSFH
jgi:hypothetical protein